MRGRKPKPKALKELAGNPGKRPLNSREPRPKPGKPSCPKWLSEDAKALWRKLVPELARLGLATLADAATLAGLCQAWAELKAATELLDKEGRVLEHEKRGSYSHPALAMQRSAMNSIRQYAALFGLDPSSRSRLVVPGGDQDELTELEEFLASGP